MTHEHASAPVAIGDVIAGKYRVEKVLGAGAMGVVVAAMHMDLQEVRAVKFMLPAVLGDAEGVERFLREARAAAKLKSQHVVKVHDIGRLENGAPYTVMEYLKGSDLKEILLQRGTLPVNEAVFYLLQACEAIGEAHAAGIVHRDIKPANLFVTTGPTGAPCVKVLDFGIAKVSTSGPSAVAMTGAISILGTPLYMSPEQMRTARDVDARTDIWALGVVLYQMLTGQMPFTGTSIIEICTAVATEQPPRPTALRPELPSAIEIVILRCLAKNPVQRYQTIQELMAVMAPFGPAVAAYPGYGQVAATASPPQAFAQTAASTVAQTAASTLAQTTAPTVAPTAAPTVAPTAASSPPPSAPKAPILIGGLLVLAGAITALVVFVILPSQRRESLPAARAEATSASGNAAVQRPENTVSAEPSARKVSARDGRKSSSTANGGTTSAAKGSAAGPSPPPVASESAAASTAAADLPIGSKCSKASQCKSGFCFDNVCCDSDCSGKCMACTPSKKFSGGKDGSCGFISGGEDPDKECGEGALCNGFGGCFKK